MRTKRQTETPPNASREIRRVFYGSTYWLRHVSGELYMVTADGTPISSPASYAATLASLDAVTAQ